MINSTEKYIFFPFINTIKHYNLTKLKADLLSGFTVAIVALPQSMAYAVIAGIHPKYGLYASVVPVIISSLFRSSRYLIAGATNATAMVTASTFSSIVIGNLVADSLPDPQKIQLLFLLVFLMGVIQLILGIARFGNLINFVSHSVTIGFTTGVGLLIALNQIKNLFGISIPTNSMAVKTIFQIVQHIELTNWYSLIIGIGTIVGILILKKILPRVPGSFLIISIMTFVVIIFQLNQYGVKLVGNIPRTFPPLSFFPFDFETVGAVFLPAMAIAIFAMVETLSVSKSISSISGERINGNLECIAQGLSNISGAFFSSMPSSGSSVRSTINFVSGASTRFAGVYSGFIVLFIIIILSSFASYIPISSLAGMLLVIAYNMINKKGIELSLKATRADRLVLIITTLSTIFLRLDQAVYIGVVLSILMFLRFMSRPSVFRVIPRPEDGKLVPYKTNMSQCQEVVIYQIEGALFFGAVNELEQQLMYINHQPIDTIILRLKYINLIDATAVQALDKFLNECADKNTAVIFVGVKPNVYNVFKRIGLLKKIGNKNIVTDTNTAIHLAYKTYVTPEHCRQCRAHAFKECKEMIKKLE